MKPREVHYIPTGGTIGSTPTSNGRETSAAVEDEILEHLRANVPCALFIPQRTVMRGDSSDHPRRHVIELGRTALEYADSGEGTVISHGTDTINLSAATLALMGNERWKSPVVFLGSMKGLDVKGSDAPANITTAGYFAAYGNGSGVFAVRPEGVIITNRHDTPAGSIDWHSRPYQSQLAERHELHRSAEERVLTSVGKSEEEQRAYEARTKWFFARVPVEDNGFMRIPDMPKKRKYHNRLQELCDLIEYQREIADETLDSFDQIVVGGRGWVPQVHIIGYGKDKIVNFKSALERRMDEMVAYELRDFVGQMKCEGKVVGRMVHYLALIENIRRAKKKKESLQQRWQYALQGILTQEFGAGNPLIDPLCKFWEKYSKKNNDDLDFSGILQLKAGTDPDYFFRLVEHAPLPASFYKQRELPDYG